MRTYKWTPVNVTGWLLVLMLVLEVEVGGANYFYKLEATNEKQIITSLNFPSNYNNSLSQSWVLYANKSKSRIELMVLYSSIEYSAYCSKDSVSVFEDQEHPSLMLKFCGLKLPTVVAKGAWMMVNFTTDNSTTDTGFKIQYRAVGKDSPESEFVGRYFAYIGSGIFILVLVFFAAFKRSGSFHAWKLSRRTGGAASLPPAAAPAAYPPRGAPLSSSSAGAAPPSELFLAPGSLAGGKAPPPYGSSFGAPLSGYTDWSSSSNAAFGSAFTYSQVAGPPTGSDVTPQAPPPAYESMFSK